MLTAETAQAYQVLPLQYDEDSNTLTIYSDAEPGIETVLDATDGQVSFVDGNGTTVRIRLNGDGQVTVRQNTAGDITRITVDGSTDRSNLTINTVGNNDTTVGDIFINGSLRNLNGRQVDLGGDLIVTGVIHNIRLDDVDNDHLIEIQGEGAEPNDRVTMHFDNVTDTEINSAIGINRLTVTGTWDDTDGLPDLIVAPWINTLNAREDFSVGLDLSGEFSPNRFTLRNANIRGDITDADWLIFGDMGRLRVDDVINFSLELNSSFRNLRFDEMINTDISVDGEAGTIQAHEWLSGSLTAETLRTLRVIERFGANLSLFGVFDGNQPSIRNIRVGEIAGGVWEVLGEAHNVITDRIDMAWNATFEGLRNLNVRGRASGNLTADWIGRFNVRNDLIDAVVNIIDRAPNGLSLARLNVRDEINNSDIRTMYDIGTVTAEQMLDSNLFAGINAGLDSLPDDAADFDTLATIRRLNLRRTRFVPSFINSNVAASEIQSFNLSDVDATNDGDTFGIATGSLRRLDYIVDDERVRLRSAGDVAAQSFDDDFLVRII